MPNEHSLNLARGRLLTLIVLPSLLIGLAGAWPMYRWMGMPGLLAISVAWSAAAVPMLGGAMLLFRASKRGGVRTAQVFLATSFVRMPIAVGLGFAAHLATDIGAGVLLIWLAVFYAAMIISEGAYLARVLRTDVKPEWRTPEKVPFDVF